MALSIFDQKTVRDSWKRKLSWRERDLTDTREAGFTKIQTQDAGFFACLSGIRETVTTQIHEIC